MSTHCCQQLDGIIASVPTQDDGVQDRGDRVVDNAETELDARSKKVSVDKLQKKNTEQRLVIEGFGFESRLGRW